MSLCEKCKYFSQHYKIENGVIEKIMCGYCTKKLRTRKSSPNSCEHFEEIELYNEKLFSTKKLLSTLSSMENKIINMKDTLNKWL